MNLKVDSYGRLSAWIDAVNWREQRETAQQARVSASVLGIHSPPAWSLLILDSRSLQLFRHKQAGKAYVETFSLQIAQGMW